MKFFALHTKPLLASMAFALALPGNALVQDTSQPQEEEDGGDSGDAGDADPQDAYDDTQSIIVTAAARIRQGGAQDIKHFRSVSLDGSFLPPASSLTMEGLLGEHDLTLPARDECSQLFCVNTHAMDAALPGREQDTYFVGLGFDSGIDAEVYRAEPVSLIALVDRSGSMSGEPMDRVKESLHSVLSQLRDGDRMGIVIYGSVTERHLDVLDVGENRDRIRKAIDAIEINGSTYMEAGMKLGFETAFNELEHSRGKTRVMLFTDENPNVGDISAEGFMGQAISASRKGVGLTTIGVGTHFDASLATRVSSVRGGNLFFVSEGGGARELFAKEFYNMIGEVAHDVAITIAPADGYKVTGVFGVPDGLMTQADDGLVTVTIGSAFLSSNGGGIYFSLGKNSERAFLPPAPTGDRALAQVAISYVDALSGETFADRRDVRAASHTPPERLRAAHLLVDEYLTLTNALDAYHGKGDKKAAYHALDGLSQRIAAADVKGFGEEQEMIDGLRSRAAYLAGYSGEMPSELRPLSVLGSWRVLRHRGVDDIARGDIVEFTEDNDMTTYRMSGRDEGEEVYQSFQTNEQRVYIEGTDLVLAYSLHDDRLRLIDRADRTEILLEKISSEES